MIRVFPLCETRHSQSLKAILRLYKLKILFLPFDKDNVGNPFILVMLDEVFGKVALANAARISQVYDVALAYARIHDVGMMFQVGTSIFLVFYNPRR